jgi:hypothetical protein
MRLINSLLTVSCIILLSSCEFKCSVGNSKEGDPKATTKSVTSSTVEKDGAVVTNNININVKGVKLKKATLLLPNNNQVADDNVVELNQKIRLALFIEDGWKLKDGKAFVGGSEKMTSSEGDVIVDAADLFSDYDQTGIDPEDAKVISLSAVIQQESSNAKHYNVEYKFYIKH